MLLKWFKATASRNILSKLEIIIIVLLAMVPLFASFPYRVNIFISWEGAYRMSNGDIPYKDFGIPMGYGFWIIPAVFFKIFGPYMLSLIKAQVFINIISGLAFRSILKSLRIEPIIRFISVLLYVLSFSFFNFWPWYNHTVIVYEFVGLAFLLKYLMPANTENKPKLLWLIGAAFFLFLSFFTKQDGGGLGIMIGFALLGYHAFINKTIKPFFIFLLSYAVFALLLIVPFLPYRFSYWFNHGQPPHNSRLALSDFTDEIFNNSQFLKFYFLLIVLLLIPFLRDYKSLIKNQRLTLLTILCGGIWVEATLLQVTSYTPPDNNIFFHSFSFMFILTLLFELKVLKLYNYGNVFLISILLLFWWSGVYWKYIDRVIARAFPERNIATPESIVSRRTFLINNDTTDVDMSKWIFSSFPSFRKIYMPPSTVYGMDRLKNNKVFQEKNARILNMTELTPLEKDLNIALEKSTGYPLWYHLGVCMFDEQEKLFGNRIANNYYNLVLFENIPTLNNFFPFAIRDSLQKHYILVDSFLAPRRPTDATIEVYQRK